MDLGSLFSNFSQYAFRVEALPVYSVGDEKESFAAFKRGEPLPSDHNSEWAQIIENALSRGARMERLRLLSDPLTEYERYEVEAAYVPGIRAGEDIRIATRPDEPVDDFWAFDDRWYALMNYSPSGEFLGIELSEWNDEIDRQVREWRNFYESLAKKLDT